MSLFNLPNLPNLPAPPPPPVIDGSYTVHSPTQQSFGANGDVPLPRNPPRRFFYDNAQFSEPGGQHTTRSVMESLTDLYPELKNGSWTSVMSPEGYEDITFFKVTGEKGLDRALFRLAEAKKNVTRLLDLAETAEDSDWAWRAALSWDNFAGMWQEVVEVKSREVARQ